MTLSALVHESEPLARRLFDAMRQHTHDGIGITRASYGPGEQYAHDLMAETAAELGLEIERDAALNTYMTLPGRDRSAPRVLIGSHLDSVAQGGNFDGAAGVVAGLTALAALRAAGHAPAADVTVMGIRAEESAWFAPPISAAAPRSASCRRARSTPRAAPTPAAAWPSTSPRPAAIRTGSATARPISTPPASAPSSSRTSSRGRCSRPRACRSAS